MRALLLAVALLYVMANVSIADKITVDPNAPGAQGASEAQSGETDERLAQKVSYEATRKAVLSILEELSVKSGVSLRAGYSKFDWQVRDRKMNIYSKDATLADLMNSIAHVMKFRWSKEKLKDGKFVYRLYMDRKSLLDEEARRARDEGRRAAVEAEKRQKALESFQALGDLPPEAVAELRKENPFKYFIAKSGLGKSLGAFMGELPAVMQALTSGQPMTMPGSALSAQGRTAAVQAMRDLWRFESMIGGRTTPFPEEVASAATDQLSINVNSRLDSIRQSQDAMFMLGQVEMRCGDTRVRFDIVDPDSHMARAVGQMLVEAEETGRSFNDVERSVESLFTDATMADVKREDPAEARVERPDDPSLRAKVKVSPKSPGLPGMQSALADASGFGVVSDSFVQLFGQPVPTDKAMELGELLDKIGEGYRYDWDKRGSVIEFRDKKWFNKRAAQIPEAWIERWRKTLKDTGTLELDDLVQICGLTLEQFQQTIVGDNVLIASDVAGVYYGGRDILKLYGTLSDFQRSAVFAESGLDLKLLNPEQWAQAFRTINPLRPGLLQNQDVSMTLAASREDRHGLIMYTFKIATSDGGSPLDWRIITPRYVEPPKPEEEKKPESK
jgi:hypothetical protein